MSRFDVTIFSWQGTVLSRIFPVVLLYMLYAAVWVHVYVSAWGPGQGTSSAQAHLVPVLSVVLGCLLGVRTSSAYERYSEGCRCWSSIILSSRNFLRHMLHGRSSGQDTVGAETLRATHHRAANLLLAFILSIVQHLREEITVEPKALSEAQRQLHMLLPEHLKGEATAYETRVENLPLAILSDLHVYVVHMYRDLGVVDVDQMRAMVLLLNALSDALVAMERIKRTPIPLAYTVHLRQLITVYCLALPAQLVGALRWMLVPVVGVAVFTFLGVEAIGSEIENPFEKDFNDLPSEEYCCKISEEMARMLRRGAAGQACEDPRGWVWSTDLFIAGRERMDPAWNMEHFEQVHYTLILDCSGSMSGRRWQDLVAAFRAFICALQSNEAEGVANGTAKVSVVFFATHATVMTPHHVRPAEVQDIANQPFSGGTNFDDAFAKCLEVVRESTGATREVILFLTDGQGNCVPKAQIQKLLQDHGSRIETFTCIGFGVSSTAQLDEIRALFAAHDGITAHPVKSPGNEADLVQTFKDAAVSRGVRHGQQARRTSG